MFSLAFLGILVFTPKVGNAALTNPAPVVMGSIYGRLQAQNYDLGRRDTVSGAITERSWRPENQKNRKVLYINPKTDYRLLVVAFVNTGACTGSSPTRVCQLEFRMSSNNGRTWSQALTGATTSLPIMGNKFEYTLYPDPNGKDFWVSYTYAFQNPYTSGKIARLIWEEGSLMWSISTQKDPASNFDPGTCDVPSSSFSSVGVGVQILADGSRRIWGLVSCGTGNRNYFVVYTTESNFENVGWSGSWTNSFNYGFTTPLLFSSSNTRGSEPRALFFPVGNKKNPAIIYSKPAKVVFKIEQICGVYTTTCVSGDGQPLNLRVLKSQYDTVWQSTSGPTIALANFAGMEVYYFEQDPCAANDNEVCHGFRAGDLEVASAQYQFDFTVGSGATGDLTGRMVVAYEGGKTYNNVEKETPEPYDKKIRAQACSISIATDLAQTSSVDCAGGEEWSLGNNNYYSPSVGFFGQHANGQPKAWVAARNTNNNQLTIFEELNPPSLGWGWNPASDQTVSVFAQTPSIANFVPYDALDPFVINSGLPPIMWSQIGSQRVSFSANLGGTSIGPSEAANPVMGWGWSSNFGWLSLNCGNNTDCTDSTYGAGIGFVNNTVPAATAVAPNGYRFGGYAWSSNAGWLSFERKESVTAANPHGNPPGNAYHNSILSDGTVALAKYDPSTQKVYGWGRFLNLCDLDSGTGRCTNDDEGWIRLRGYFKVDTNPSGTLTVACNQCSSLTLSSADIVNFGSDGATGIAMLDSEYVKYTRQGSNGLALDPGFVGSYPAGSIITNVTSQEYGVEAFWSGSFYELYGWGWSDSYGWIQFRPLIFLGYAWLETLFGNVYSVEDIMLPKPEKKSGEAIMCDYDGDGTFDDECAVSTYRIEASGNITPFTLPGSGYTTGLPTSHFFGSATGSKPKIEYPSSQSVIYRNVLGKLDLAGLIGFVSNPIGLQYLSGTTPKIVNTGQNRFGNSLFETSAKTGEEPTGLTTTGTWTSSLLQGLKFSTTQDAQWATHVPPLQKLDSQVIHISGDFTVDGGNGKYVTRDVGAGTLTVNGGDFPTPSAQYVQGGTTYDRPNCAGCALVIDPGTANEEYVSYTGYDSATKRFSGVQSLTSVKSHDTESTVRFAWRLPFTTGETSAQTTTIVVDGNLKINYNIISSEPNSPSKIRDVPTIAFVVKGDVEIEPTVNQLIGAFIVMGKEDGTGGAFKTGNDLAYCPTGTGGSQKCIPLLVEGLILARSFVLERYGSKDLTLPGEKIIYDQRLYLNPPPGLADVSKALPNPTRTQP